MSNHDHDNNREPQRESYAAAVVISLFGVLALGCIGGGVIGFILGKLI